MPVLILADPSQLAETHSSPKSPALTRWGEVVDRPAITQWISRFTRESIDPVIVGLDLVVTTQLEQVYSVLIDGEYYGLGQFILESGVVRVEGVNQARSVVIVGVAKETCEDYIQSNIIPKPYPFFLQSQNWTGQITLNRSLESHPSGSIELIAHQSQETAIRELFRNGNEIGLWGLPLMVNSLQISRLSGKKYPSGAIYAQISLQGKYAERGGTARSKLDTQIFVRSLLGNQTYIELSDLARASQVRYGGSNVKISFPSDTPAETTTTLRQNLTDFAPHLQGFLFWSNPSQVEIRPILKTAIHPIPSHTVKDERINYTYSGHGAIVDGIQLSEEYRNRTFTLDVSLTDQNSEKIVLWEFENAKDFFDCEQPPKSDRDPTFFGVTDLASGGNCFDGGGIVKTARKHTSINGQEIETEEWKFGYAFLTKQTYTFYQLSTNGKYFIKVNDSPTNRPEDYWMLVEHTITRKGFADEPLYPKKWKGYLVLEQKTGTKKVRFKTESAHETADLWKELLDDSINGITPENLALLTDKISVYDWFDAGVKEDTTYNLTSLSDYYSDIESPPCDPAMEWIEPVFAQVIERTSNDFFKRPDPESTKDEPKPDLVMGQTVKEKTEIVIITPQSPSALLQKPEKFKEVRYNSNIEGENMKNAIRIASVTEQSGRPPIHTRLTPYTPPDPNLRHIQLATNQTYILNSLNAEVSNNAYYDSLSFSRLVDIIGKQFISVNTVRSTLYALAKTQLDFNNSKSALTVTLNIVWRNDLCEGDMVLWDNQLWLILSINQTQQIQPYKGSHVLTCDQLELNLGRVLRVPMSITTKEKGKQIC